MIPNITRGGRTAGVLVYLVGPGRENEHSEPHLVAGDSSVLAWHGDSELDRAAALEIAQTLDHPWRVFGTRVTTAVKDSDGRRVGERDAHVWHCSLNLAAEEGALADEQWARICEDFVERMGFAGDEYPCRWVAVRHGASKSGNDHVHVVVSLVHEDGRAADVWNDRPRAQQACGELERQHGLRVLESRAAGRGGARGHKPAERATADRRGSEELARERLERVVRACAAASVDEAEFVRRVRQAGVRLRPRYAAGRDDVVAGYSAALRAPAGQAPVYYGGGHLARDLTLPRLRERWPDTPEAAQAAVAEWNAARRNRHMVAPGREQHEPDPELWARYGDELAQLREQLRAVSVDDVATPGPLAAAAAQLARSAQLHAHQVRPSRARLPAAGGAALLLASAARGGRGAVGEAALLRQLANTAQALHDAHVAVGEARSAQALADAVRGQLAAVGRELSGAAPGPAPAAPGAAPRAPGAPLPGALPDRSTSPAARPASTPAANRAPGAER